MFNPIELAWSGLKSYVREHNTNFRLSNVRNLTQTCMTSLDVSTAASYLDHARNTENTFKKSDCFTKQIEEQIIDDEDDEMDSEAEEISEWPYAFSRVLLLFLLEHHFQTKHSKT
jgi:hypothetical protein